MLITNHFTAYPQTASGPASATPPAADALPAPVTAQVTSSATEVTLSAQGRALAVSTSTSGALRLPDLEGIADVQRALDGVPDTGPAQARARAQREREQDKHKSKFSMLDVDALRNLREKLRAKLQQRPEAPVSKQQADEARFRKNIDDGQPLTGNPS